MSRPARLLAPLLAGLVGCADAGTPGEACAGGKCDEPIDLCAERAGTFPESWIAGGPDCGIEPAIQVHAYGDDNLILRQSLCTSAEAPFLYLLFGDERALLFDSGDDAGVSIPLVEVIDGLLAEREVRTGRAVELLVLNSHAHRDHVGYNRALEDHGFQVVGFTAAEIADFFGFDWPDGQAEIDLGDRLVDLLPIPGHEANHIALYDRRDGLLLTGDTLYPGRLFIADFATYEQNIGRLVDFTETRPVCHVLGAHIEMTTTPGEEYPFNATHHPDEHPLRLDRAHLLELAEALEQMNGGPRHQVHDDFIIFPL